MIEPSTSLPWLQDEYGIYGITSFFDFKYLGSNCFDEKQDEAYALQACNEYPALKEQNERLIQEKEMLITSLLNIKLYLKDRFDNVEEGDVEFELIKDCEDALEMSERFND